MVYLFNCLKMWPGWATEPVFAEARTGVVSGPVHDQSEGQRMSLLNI